MPTNEQIIKSAGLTTGDVTSGILSPEQSRTFIKETFEATPQITENTADVKELFHRVKTLEHDSEENAGSISKIIAENREQFKRIETIEKLSGDIKSLTESVYNIALSTRDIKGGLDHVAGRLDVIENDKRQKNYAVWQIIVSAFLGGGLTFAITKMLGG